MLDEEPLFTPLTIENIPENAQKSKVMEKSKVVEIRKAQLTQAWREIFSRLQVIHVYTCLL